jgi:hypothetical protein
VAKVRWGFATRSRRCRPDRDAGADTVTQWIARSLDRPEVIDAGSTGLVATIDEPDWYAEQLTAIRAPFHIVKPREMREVAHVLGQRVPAGLHPAERGRPPGPTRLTRGIAYPGCLERAHVTRWYVVT